MAADIATSLKDWSTTESSNAPSGTTAISTNLDDNLRMLQKVLRDVYSIGTIASAATCDIGAQDAGILGVTGTTNITSLGTVSAGITKYLVFGGVLTFTHNGTSLIVPGGSSITTAANDIAKVVSLGSGNWRVLSYVKASGLPIASLTNIPDGTVGAPGLAFTNELSTGLYRFASNYVGMAVGGVVHMYWSAANGVIVPVKTTIGPTNNTLEMSASAGLSVTTTVGVNLASSGGVNISSSSALGASPINLTCTSGNGINLQGGNVVSGLLQGGSISIASGDYSAGSSSGGGVLNMRAGNSNGFSAGGAVSITGGNATASVSSGCRGGDVTITGGLTTYTSGAGGARGGNVVLVGGACGNELATGVTGGIVLKPGLIGSGLAAAGSVELQAHDATKLLIASGQRKTVTLGGPTPTLTSGAGTGATISGNSNCFKITLGTSPTTSVVVTGLAVIGGSGNPWPNAPVVMTNYETADINTRASATTSALTITFASTPAAGGILHVMCFAPE